VADLWGREGALEGGRNFKEKPIGGIFDVTVPLRKTILEIQVKRTDSTSLRRIKKADSADEGGRLRKKKRASLDGR